MSDPDSVSDEDRPAAGDPFGQLVERLNELSDLNGAATLLFWDQETMLPPAGTAVRAHQRATVERLAHYRLTAPQVGDWLEQCSGVEHAGSDAPGENGVPTGEPSVKTDLDAALVRVTRQDR